MNIGAPTTEKNSVGPLLIGQGTIASLVSQSTFVAWPLTLEARNVTDDEIYCISNVLNGGRKPPKKGAKDLVGPLGNPSRA
jgi:hypothetical protein